jgi:hypothetical protein
VEIVYDYKYEAEILSCTKYLYLDDFVHLSRKVFTCLMFKPSNHQGGNVILNLVPGGTLNSISWKLKSSAGDFQRRSS